MDASLLQFSKRYFLKDSLCKQAKYVNQLLLSRISRILQKYFNFGCRGKHFSLLKQYFILLVTRLNQPVAQCLVPLHNK